MANAMAYDKILEERDQGHSTRKHLYETLAGHLERPVVSFFTSFGYPVQIEDTDADMLEGVLKSMNLTNGLALFISSPGGDGMAAERIVNLCRTYSGTGDYWAVVPSKAKSAATMVCFGASKIIMGGSSELGPVDPQVRLDNQIFSVFNLVNSYDDLFARAVKEKNRLEPYIQQLEHYDARLIAELRSAQELAEDISLRLLKTGMMKGKSEAAIKSKIATFLTPKKTKAHGRPIYQAEAGDCGLVIDNVNVDSDFWNAAYELYARGSTLVETHASKCIESCVHSYVAQA